MPRLIVLALVGIAAQLVDGGLGMAYGVTGTTLLLAVGAAPASASAAVHLAEVGTSFVSGVAHHKFGNVDWAVVRRIAIPGGLSAFAGATLLSSVSTEAAAPWMAGVLLLLGCYLLVRFSFRPPVFNDASLVGPRRRFLLPLGAVAGFVDATGGGGWGPIATPALLADGKLAPHRVIGSVSASELVVAVSASVGFLLGLSLNEIPLDIVAALLVGGVVAAPIAAWLVRRIPSMLLGSGVGGLIVLTNSRVLLRALDAGYTVRFTTYGTIVLLWAVALVISVRALRRDRAARESADPAAPDQPPTVDQPAA